MNRAILAALCLLCVQPAGAQILHPPRGSVAQLGACNLVSFAAGPRLRSVTDGQDASDCDPVSGGGGSHVHLCYCDGNSWAVLSGAGGADDQTAVEVPYAPTTGADWQDPNPTEVGGALDALAGTVAALDPDLFLTLESGEFLTLDP